MSSDKEYRMQAQRAEQNSRVAKNVSEREAWLLIAQGWLDLIRKRPQRNAEAFEIQSTENRTHDESGTSQ
jgi:hypothetical protein